MVVNDAMSLLHDSPPESGVSRANACNANPRRNTKHALDNLCNFADPVGAGTGHIVHVGWVYSHSALTGDRCLGGSINSRTQNRLAAVAKALQATGQVARRLRLFLSARPLV